MLLCKRPLSGTVAVNRADVTWVGRRVVCRRHVRQGSAASSGPGSGWAGTLDRHTTGNLFRWPTGTSVDNIQQGLRCFPKMRCLMIHLNMEGLKSSISFFLFFGAISCVRVYHHGCAVKLTNAWLRSSLLEWSFSHFAFVQFISHKCQVKQLLIILRLKTWYSSERNYSS